jgi:putative ABC transport system permease protein
MLGRVLAANLDKKAGDAVEPVKGQAYRVVGICESFNVFENGSMIMTLGDLQELMDRKGEVTYFSVTADRKDRAALEELRRRIEALAPALQALPTREYADSSVEIRTARAVAWLTSTIAVLIGAVGMINTMLTAVFERTRELAVLRAIGWSKFQVMKLVMLESLLLAAVGAVAGTLLAMALTLVLCRLPASGGLVSGNIAPAVMLQGLAIAIVVGVLGGAYPAYRAARLMPTVGLRHE